MKIKSTTSSRVQRTDSTQKKDGAKGSKAPAKSGGNAATNVSISGTASKISALQGQARSVSTVDEAKVAQGIAIRDGDESGVDMDKVVDGLLADL